MTRKKQPFEKGKIYYYPIEDWKIRFVEMHEGSLSVGGLHYVFKVTGNSEWDELSTTKPEEIFSTKTEYTRQLKAGKAPDYNKLDIPTATS